MKKLVLILLLAIAKVGFAQQDTTLIYNSPMYTKDPVRSKWRPVIKHVGEFYQVAFYDRKDVLQETISFEDKDLTIRKGPYVGYKNGIESEKGQYDKGHKHGEWLKYSGGSIVEKDIYAWGKLNGVSTKYWSNQQLQEEGSYSNGKKIGEWKLYHKNAQLAGKETYEESGKKIASEYFYNDGKPAKYEDLFHPPSYKGGIQQFYRFLSSEINYSRSMAEKNLEGTVILSFLVKTDGTIDNIEVVKNPATELTLEAIRVLQKSGEWVAGVAFGEQVNTRFSIPIKFAGRR